MEENTQQLQGRMAVPAAEALIGKSIECLNHGYVKFIDYMGGDKRIADAARISYGDGTRKISDDRHLIRYMWRNSHTSPFEQVQLTFMAKMPIFVARQWVRHRTARLNEISGRYSILKDEFYLPNPEHVCYQSDSNKQGRSGPIPLGSAHSAIAALDRGQTDAYETYMGLIRGEDEEVEGQFGFGVSRELARINLPLSTYTEWYWQCDLHNLLNFLRLRLDPHAQYEIRVYAEAMAQFVQAVAPLAWEAFRDYTLEAAKFSRMELNVLEHLLRHVPVQSRSTLKDVGTQMALSDRELGEFLTKLRKLSVVIDEGA